MTDISLQLDPALIGSSEYGDLLFKDGDLVLTSDSNPQGTNFVLQNVCQRLRFFLGNWFMNTGAGVPWFQQILVKNADQGKIDAILRNCILGTPGVAAMTSYSSQADRLQRRFTVRFAIRDATGNVLATAVAITTDARMTGS